MRDPRSSWTQRLGAVLALGALLMGSHAGCDNPSDEPSCAFEGTVNEPDAALDASASAEVMAEAQGLAFLEGFLGPFVRGEVPVYRGTLTAHDNQSVLGPPPVDGGLGFEDQSIPEGAAVAALSVTPTSASLAIHSFAQHEYVVLEQDQSTPGVTSIGIILGDAVSGGNSGLCNGCVPAFRDKPAILDFPNASATTVVNIGVGTMNKDVTLHTYAAASLELVPPCGLTMDDIAELNASSGVTFAQSGSEWVAEWSGTAARDLLGYSYCVAPFTIELYVSASNLAVYGVRNVQLFDSGCGF
jgi:hypothetical protein